MFRKRTKGSGVTIEEPGQTPLKDEQELLYEAAEDLKAIIAVLRYNADQLAAKLEEIKNDRSLHARENPTPD